MWKVTRWDIPHFCLGTTSLQPEPPRNRYKLPSKIVLLSYLFVARNWGSFHGLIRPREDISKLYLQREQDHNPQGLYLWGRRFKRRLHLRCVGRGIKRIREEAEGLYKVQLVKLLRAWYNNTTEREKMYNWSVDLKKLGNTSEEAKIWRLEQIINFGLNGQRLDKSAVKRFWQRLRLDPQRKRFLKFLLWPKKS